MNCKLGHCVTTLTSLRASLRVVFGSNIPSKSTKESRTTLNGKKILNKAYTILLSIKQRGSRLESGEGGRRYHGVVEILQETGHLPLNILWIVDTLPSVLAFFSLWRLTVNAYRILMIKIVCFFLPYRREDFERPMDIFEISKGPKLLNSNWFEIWIDVVILSVRYRIYLLTCWSPTDSSYSLLLHGFFTVKLNMIWSMSFICQTER